MAARGKDGKSSEFLGVDDVVGDRLGDNLMD